MKSAYPMTSMRGLPIRQRGAATLLVALIALFLITIMTIYTAKVGVMDQRMSGNEYRYREASAAAEAGLNQAVAFFKARPGVGINAYTRGWTWTNGGCRTDVNSAVGNAQCTQLASNLSLANGSNQQSQVSWARVVRCSETSPDDAICPHPRDAGGNAVSPFNYYVFRAQGTSADGSGTAAVEQKIAFAATTNSSAPNAPVVAAGNVGLGGNFNIVANPNGGGPGVAISVWSHDAVGGTGSPATCNQSGFDLGTNKCTTDILSTTGSLSTDVVAKDALVSQGGNFPDDVFQYLFGVKSTDYTTVKNRATPITDCGTLGPKSVGLYWYTGADCQVAKSTVGAAADDPSTPDVEGPVILVVQDAQFTMNANTTLNGIIFIFSSTSPVSNLTVKTNGGALVNGVLMTNTALNDQINGTFTARYDAAILAQLSNSGSNNGPANGTPADVPGSWRDF